MFEVLIITENVYFNYFLYLYKIVMQLWCYFAITTNLLILIKNN